MLDEARAITPDLIQLRRTLHKWPELSYEEYRTAALVARQLHDLGIPHETEIARTGVVGWIGQGDGPVVALRADMDALPIHEENETSYVSQRPGIMHACGHDAHTTMLLGAARLLKAHESELNGRVKLIFQPSEESFDANGKSGARTMIEEGVADDIDAIFGLHVDPSLDVGTIGIRPGPMMASADRFDLEILGRKAHGAYAYQGVDAIVLAAQVINGVQLLISRRIPAVQEGVITIGAIHGGNRENVLCDRVLMAGTVRAFDPAIRDQLESELEEVAAIARQFGGDYRLHYIRGNPPVINDGKLTGFLSRVGNMMLGPEGVVEAAKTTGGEDFAWYNLRTRGSFVRIGARSPGWPAQRSLHTATFDIDEGALTIGAALLAQSAERWLREYDAHHWQGSE